MTATSIEAYFEAGGWYGAGPEILEVPVNCLLDGQAELEAALREALQATGRQENAAWIFLRPVDAWFHRAEATRFFRALEKVDHLLKEQMLAFAFVDPGSQALELSAGLLLGRATLQALTAPPPGVDDGYRKLRASAFEALGITVVHTPWMVPDAAALPQNLRGMVSEGVLSGIWSVGQVRDEDAMDDLDAKAEDRVFFTKMVIDNFQDLLDKNMCSSEMLERARLWMKYLHHSNEHIEVMRSLKSGHREFRALHAMYRSEASHVFPHHGVSADSMQVARDCDAL